MPFFSIHNGPKEGLGKHIVVGEQLSERDARALVSIGRAIIEAPDVDTARSMVICGSCIVHGITSWGSHRIDPR